MHYWLYQAYQLRIQAKKKREKDERVEKGNAFNGIAIQKRLSFRF